MKTNLLTLASLYLLIFFSCDKTESIDDNLRIDSTSIYKLEINLNGTRHKEYLFSNSEVIEEVFHEQDLKLKKIKYVRGESGLTIQKLFYDIESYNYKIDSLFYNASGQIDYIIPYHYADLCNCLYNSSHYLLMEYNEQDLIANLIDYDSINFHFLTQSFLYNNKQNVVQKNYPLETGLPQYAYEYDDKNSIYQKMNLPKIDELSISKNNITKVTIKRQSMTWDEISGDPIYSTSENELYSSKFTYDSLDYPTTEIRYSATRIDTLEYKIIIVE